MKAFLAFLLLIAVAAAQPNVTVDKKNQMSMMEQDQMVGPVLSAPNNTGETGAISFVPKIPQSVGDYQKNGLKDVSPFLALFDTANHYRQQFDANQEGYFFQNLYDLKPSNRGPGGTLKRWEIDNPALYGQAASQALIEFEPCGLNLPHVHPRALEFLHVLYGNLTITFIEENGGRAISKTLSTGDSIFVPQGLVHGEHNLGCEPAAFMNTFTAVNPGTSTIHNALLQFPKDTIITAMGNIDGSIVDQLRAKQPVNLAQGPPSCLQRCGISSVTSQSG